MHVVAKAYWLPKKGMEEAEYEDAFAPDGAQLETDLFRCAIADGATEASFSKQWARTLVKAWERGSLTKERFLADIGQLQDHWRKGFAEVRQSQKLSWFAEQKADLGAFAALVGFVLHHDRPAGAEPVETEPVDTAEPDRSAAESATETEAADTPQLGTPWWEALAVGDCNLFQLRDGRLLTAFPLTESTQFNGGPFLVPTRGTAGSDLGRHTRIGHGDWLPHDTFYLMTDALAAWFLRCCEAGEQPWGVLEQVLGTDDPQEEFASLVRGLREQKLLHNDDVTLLTIQVELAPAAVAAAPPLLAWDELAPEDTDTATPTEPTDIQEVREQES